MKKLLLLSVVGIFSLSSFTIKQSGESSKLYQTTCKNGKKYLFTCDCSLADAQFVGNSICNSK